MQAPRYTVPALLCSLLLASLLLLCCLAAGCKVEIATFHIATLTTQL